MFLPQRRIFHFWKIHVSTTSHKLYFFVVLMPFHHKLLLWLFSVICLCITNWAPQIKYSLRAERLRYLMWCDDVKPLIFMAYSRLILLLFTLIIHSLFYLIGTYILFCPRDTYWACFHWVQVRKVVLTCHSRAVQVELQSNDISN